MMIYEEVSQMNLIESLNESLEIKEEDLDAMITELTEREEFSGGGSSNYCNISSGESCYQFTCITE